MLHLSWHEHLDVDDQVPAVRGMQVRVNRYGTPASTNSTSPVTLSSDAYCSSVGGVSGVVTETLASIREGGSLAARVETAALSAEQTRSAGSPAEQLRRAARGAQTGRRQRAPFRARSTSARTRQPAR